MPPKVHVLIEKNLDQMMGVCRQCGPVDLYRWQEGGEDRYKCSVAERLRRKDERGQRRWIHQLIEKDIENLTGVCKNCGPVQLHEFFKNERISHRCLVGHLANSRNKYGKQRPGKLSLEEYDILMSTTDVCLICKNPCVRRKRLCIDHEHETGTIRGLLCCTCNLGLGHFFDSVELLKAAIEYLSNPESFVSNSVPGLIGVKYRG